MRDQARLLAIVGVIAILTACSAGPTGQTSSPPPTGPMPTGANGTTGPTEPPSPAPTDAITPPNSYQLLNEALARGEIDDEQVLVYKIFASFNDPRLPAEYRGDDAELHDGMVVAEALARWDSLSPETQATLAPFTLWPGEPGSWLQLQEGIAGGPLAVVGPMAQTDAPPIVILPLETSPNVRVWYRQDRPEDQAVAQSIVGMVDTQVWPKLTELMGPPKSDLGMGNLEGNGEDPRIDIVLSGEDIRSFARPFDCHETSGFIQLGTQGTNLHTVTHELTHVIEFKYPVSTGCQSPEYTWLHEAVAQWSIDYVDPATQAERGTKTGLLPKACFLDVPGLPLDLRNDCHEYGSYLFFQYLDRSYAPSYIPAVWAAAAGEDSLGAINSVVASAGGMAEVWPDFALAAYNVDPSKRFQQWDSLSFGARVEQVPVALGGASSRDFTARGDVEHMAALYTGFRFEDAKIKKVTFSHPFSGNPAARVTAVVKFEGEDWKVEDWTPFAEKTFCYDDPGQKRLEQLVIIVSNSSYENGGAVLSGAHPKLTVADTCACGRPQEAISWSGTLNFAYDKSGGGAEVHRSAEVSFTFDEVYLDEEDAKSWIGDYTGGSAEERDSLRVLDRTDTVTGGPITIARGSLILDKETCLFNFNFTVTIMSTFNQFENTFDSESTVGNVTLWNVAGSEAGVGFDGQVAARVLGGEAGENRLHLLSGGQISGGYEFELMNAVGEEGLGTASVQVSLTPTYPPDQ